MIERGCPTTLVEVQAVEVEAARRVIPVEALADALVLGRDEREVAERLGVDEGTLQARQRGLTRGERAEVGRLVPASRCRGLALVTG
jgi:predicted nucleotidyltransferase